MLSRANRFSGRSSLKFVYRTGKVVRGPFFSIRYAHNQRRDNYRAAIVISRKTVKSAVKRNRIRRRIYAALQNQPGLASQPYDIVVSVFQESIIELSPAELKEQLNSQLKTASIV